MRVAIYSRKSIETDKGDSINNQLQMVKDHFKNKPCEFIEFQDEGFSGGNTNRPGFQLMVNHIQNKSIDVVAVYRIDRIARNIVDFVNFYDELKKQGVELVSITEGFDFSNHMGKMVMMILATFADMERESIRQRVKDNMREMAKIGKWTGGVVPFGYIAERNTKGSKKATYLKLDPCHQELINEIFEYYMKSQSMHQVQKWLYSEKEIKWCLSTIKNILTSPIYVKADNAIINYLKNFGEVYGHPNNVNGLLTYNRRPYTNGKHRWNDKEMFYAVSKHEGIIDSNTWLKVQSLQNKNKNTPRPKSSQVSYLTGILKCDKCGSNMTVSYNHKNKDGSITYVYLCTGHKDYGKTYCDCRQIKQIILDEELLNCLDNYLKLKKERFITRINKSDAFSNNDKINKLQKKIDINTTKISNLIDKLSELSNEAGSLFMSKIEIFTKENEDYRKDLLYLQQEQLTTISVPPEKVYDNLKTCVYILRDPNIDITTKKIAIESCVKEIRYIRHDSENIELKLTFL